MHLAPDLDQAITFIEHLCQDFGPKVTFQTFDDDPDRKDPQLARIFHGTLHKHAAELERLNNMGAGVFITVNQTNLRGRKKTDVEHVRACWCDLDGVDEVPEAKLEPSILVRTGNGWHPYWLLAEEISTVDNERLNKTIAKRLAGDLQATDCARVMRLPGFWHLKDRANPRMVRLRRTEDLFYTVKELESAFPPPPEPARKAVTRHIDRTSEGHSRYGAKAMSDELDKMRGSAEGERNHTLNACAFSLGQLIAGGELDQGPALADLKDAALAAGLPESEVNQTIASGLRSGMAQPRSAPPRPGRPQLRAVPTGPQAEPPAYLDDAPPVDDAHAPYDGKADEPWRDSLRWKITDKGTELTSDPGNLAAIMAHEEGWKGCLAFDTFSYRTYWAKSPPPIAGLVQPEGDVKDTDALFIRHWFSLHYRIKIGKDDCFAAIQLAAEQNPVHPVRDYFNSLKWDGTARLDTWLRDYAGAENTPINRKIAAWWMLSAVARIMKPGCQVDHTLILEGKQGLGKSSVCRILAGVWFQGNLGDITTKEGQQQVQGYFIIEIPELEAFRGKAVPAIKSFLTNPVDIFRPTYGRLTIKRPRQCVFVATTNEHEYLRDATGGRRFWPVRCHKIDTTGLANVRDQLWAETVQRYKAGEHWWPEDPADIEALEKLQDSRLIVSVYKDDVEAFLKTNQYTGVTVSQVLDMLDIPKERYRNHATEISQLMRSLQWEPAGRPRVGGKRVCLWRPVATQLALPETSDPTDDDAGPETDAFDTDPDGDGPVF